MARQTVEEIKGAITQLEDQLKTLETYIEENSNGMPEIVEDVLRESVVDITVAKENLEEVLSEIKGGKWK